MDEYEVNIHAMEDIEEGELTSDEEGEIKGQQITSVPMTTRETFQDICALPISLPTHGRF